jgi:hypothetical protein
MYVFKANIGDLKSNSDLRKDSDHQFQVVLQSGCGKIAGAYHKRVEEVDALSDRRTNVQNQSKVSSRILP